MSIPPPRDGEAEGRADSLFLDALALPVEEREAFLDEACTGDDRLRADVAALLHDNSRAGGFLKIDAPIAPDLEAEFARLRPEEVGERIGNYKLLEQLGEGGFGTVWVAEQERPVRRRVALKIIKLGMDTRDVVARFEQERQALAVMDHPNIAKVLDAGATPTGRPFFVMELVRGIKITEYCDLSQLSTADRLRLFLTVCLAVQHAHQKGIIHRDLKPSNILVTLHDGVPVPKVIDFGVAKATQQQRLTDLTVYTQFEQMIGTPLYMAPEQAEMSGLDIDTRSDIYSLGVLLYELLTGRTPFDPEQLMKAGYDEMRRVIREEEPQKPSTFVSTMALERRATVAKLRGAEGSKLISTIRGDLDWIVMKALEKDRNRRYETATGFARDIERHLGCEPVQARPPSAAYRFRRFVRRNKLAVAAGTAVALTLVGGVVVSLWYAHRAEAAAARAQLEATRANREATRALSAEEAQSIERRKAQSEAEKSRVVAQFLEEMLGGVKPSVALGRDTTMLREILDKTAARLGELKEQPEVEAEVRRIVGEAYGAIGNAQRAHEMHVQALELLERTVGKEHLAVASVLLSLSGTLEPKTAEPLIEQALEIRRKLLGSDHPDVALALTAKAFNLRTDQRYVEAEAIAQQAIVMCRKHFGDRHPHTAAALLALAQSVGWQKRDSESEALHREILGILREQHGEEHPEVAISLLNLAQSLHAQKRLEESASVARQARQVALRVYGAAHPTFPQMGGHLAMVLFEQGKFKEAEALTLEELDLCEQHRLFSRVPGLLDQLQAIVQAQGRTLAEDSLFRDKVMKAVAAVDRSKPGAAVQLHALAHQLAIVGEYEKADVMFAEELALRGEDSSRPAGTLWRSQPCRAKILEFRGDYGRAEPLRRAALEEAKQLAPEEPGFLEERMVELADCLYRQKKFGEAKAVYEQIIASRTARYPEGHSQLWLTKSSLARLITDWVWSDLGSAVRSSPGKEKFAQLRERAADAERTLGESLKARLADGKPATWRTQDLKSRLASAMAAGAATDLNASRQEREKKFAEAEALLLESNEALQSGPQVAPKYRRDALTRLVHLYTAWGQPRKAAEWKQRLDAIQVAPLESELPRHPVAASLSEAAASDTSGSNKPGR